MEWQFTPEDGADYAEIHLLVERYKNRFYWIGHDQDWTTFWEKVKYEIFIKHKLELSGQREPYFSKCGYSAIFQCCARRHADYLRKKERSEPHIRDHARDYEISFEIIEGDNPGQIFKIYEAVYKRSSGYFFEEQPLFDRIVEDVIYEKEIHIIIFKALEHLRKIGTNGENYYKIAKYYLEENDLEPGKQGPIPELSERLDMPRGKVSSLKHKMLKYILKILFELGIELQLQKETTKDEREEQKIPEDDKGIKSKENNRKKSNENTVVTTNIYSIDQLMDDEVREMEKLYCNRPDYVNKVDGRQRAKKKERKPSVDGSHRGLNRGVRSAIYDRPGYITTETDDMEDNEDMD